MRIGAQFYTIRDFCKTKEDLCESLKKVADIGYEYIQLSGTCDYEGDFIKKELEKNNLKCTLTHYNGQEIANNTEEVIKKHLAFNCHNIGLGSYANMTSTKTINEFISYYSNALEIMKLNDIKFMYHNHEAEFTNEDGKIILYELMEKTKGTNLGFTLDTYWIQAGGCTSENVIRDFRDRCTCVHFKDYAYPRKMLPVGKGNLNFHEIIKSCYDSNVEYAFVEQDDCNGMDPFECLKISYEYLKSEGLN